MLADIVYLQWDYNVYRVWFRDSWFITETRQGLTTMAQNIHNKVITTYVELITNTENRTVYIGL